MPRKAKATTQLNDAPRKVHKSGPSNEERITSFLANSVEFPSETFGAEVRSMLQHGFVVGSTAEVEHKYILETEQMVEDVVRDAQNYARKALAESDGKIQKLDLEMQTLKESRQSFQDSAGAAHTVVVAEKEAYHDKQTMLSRAEEDKTVTASALASSVKAQQDALKEKSSMTAVIEGSLDSLLTGAAEADGCKSKHMKTVVQLMKDIGAEASLVASIPSALSVAPADRNQWHNITIDAMKKLVQDFVAKLDMRVAAANLDFTASEAEDMGAAAIVDRFNAQVLEANVACDMAEQAAEKADASLLEMDERLRGLASDAAELKLEQTLLKGKVDEVDAVFSSLEYVRGRFQRLAAEEAKRKADAEAIAAEVTMTATLPEEEIDVPDSANVACGKETLTDSKTDSDAAMADVVRDPPHDGALISKLDVEPVVLCRTALGA